MKMFIVEGILSHGIYDALKFGAKSFLGPYFVTFQKARNKAQKQLKKEFSAGELLSIFTTFNNMEWKLSYGKNAREEINRNLIKGVEAIDGQVFVDELVTELHENHREYDIELVEKVVGRFVEIVSEELRADHEILNYLQSIRLDQILQRIDSGFAEIIERQKRQEEREERLERDVKELKSRFEQVALYLDGLPKTKDKDKKALFEKGMSLMAQYKYEEAIESFRECLALETEGSEKVALLILVGNSFYAWNKWNQALSSWEEALDAAEKARDEEGQAAALGNLGLVYKDKGEWDKAIKFYNRDLEIGKKIGDEHGMAQTFNNLGIVYRKKGEWDKAIEFYNKALKGLEKIGDELGMSQTYHNLGNVYQLKEDWAKAIEFYNKSLNIKRKIGSENGIALTETSIGILYKAQGKKEEARKLLEESLKAFEKIGDRPNAKIVREHLKDL
jgi:tetratricopeptide (TPR) repeat protein